MSRKKILMAASNAWNSIFQVGSHHLAREFLKMGYEVAFISDPISPFHIFSSSLKDRFPLYRSGGIWEENLWSYVPFTLLPPHNLPSLRSKWVHNHWHELTLPSVVQKAKQNGFSKVDILYLDTPIQSFWLKNIEAKKTVYRMADRNSGFKKSTAAQMKMEEELVQNVDHVICTAKNLFDSVQGKVKKAHYLPNGVPVAHFKKPGQIPLEYANIPKPIAVYVGAIEYWFDFKLIEKLAEEMPHVSFVLIGPVKENRPFIKNIYFLGKKSYSEVPNYLQFADVGLIPFDVKNCPDLIHSVNPLKLYEYMASGLPVVSTWWDEIAHIQSPALLSRTAEEFKSNLLQALQIKNSNDVRAFAENLDWSIRAQQLIDFIQ